MEVVLVGGVLGVAVVVVVVVVAVVVYRGGVRVLIGSSCWDVADGVVGVSLEYWCWLVLVLVLVLVVLVQAIG